MPVVAVVGAVAAIAGAAAPIGALIGGASLASIGLAGVLSITAAVGATLGAVGVVARDKTLQTVGTIIGAVGAVGSLANSAGLFGDTSDLFGTATDFSSPAEKALAETIPESVDITPAVQRSSDIIKALTPTPVDVSPLGEVAYSTPGAYQQQTPEMRLAANDLNASDIVPTNRANTPDGMTPFHYTGTDATPASELGLSKAAAATPDAPMSAAAQARAGVDMTGRSVASNFSAPGVPDFSKPLTPESMKAALSASQTSLDATPIPVGESPGFLSGLYGFAKDNPMATYGLIQAGSSLLSGLFNPLTPAQVNNYNSQADLNRAQANLIGQQVSNMQGGMPVAKLGQRTPVTGAPYSYGQGPYGQGLINSQVTGAPA